MALAISIRMSTCVWQGSDGGNGGGGGGSGTGTGTGSDGGGGGNGGSCRRASGEVV